MTPGDQPAGTEADAEKRRSAQRDLVRCYKRCLASDDGRRILKDMRIRFGYDRTSHIYGASSDDNAHREGMKEPIRHLLLMKETELEPMGRKPARVTAKAGTSR